MKKINTALRLYEDTKEEFTLNCAHVNRTPSEVLRQMVLDFNSTTTPLRLSKPQLAKKFAC